MYFQVRRLASSPLCRIATVANQARVYIRCGLQGADEVAPTQQILSMSGLHSWLQSDWAEQVIDYLVRLHNIESQKCPETTRWQAARVIQMTTQSIQMLLHSGCRLGWSVASVQAEEWQTIIENMGQVLEIIGLDFVLLHELEATRLTVNSAKLFEVELAQQQDGFIGMESAREEVGITVSYWRNLDAIKQWKANSEHLVAQRMGRATWYQAFTTRIAKVERDYSFGTTAHE